jgi:DNA-binding transcriptional MerR regulator
MPYKEKEIEKLFYSIGEVAAMFNVNASLLRFWEKEFTSILDLSKDGRGNRQYTPQDISKIRMLHNLIKEKGYTLEGAAKYLKENRKEAFEQDAIYTSLLKIREQLIALKKMQSET